MDPATRSLPGFLADAVASSPDHPFIVWDDNVITYREFDRQSDKAARAWASLGIRRADRVAMMMDNCPEYLVGWFGLAKLGAVLVAVNSRLQSREVAYVVGDAGAVVVLTDAEHLPVMQEARAELPELRVVLCTAPVAGAVSFAEVLQSVEDGPVNSAAIAGDDLVSLIYTSGSTGRPKGVMQTHANFVLTGEGYAHWFRMTQDDRLYVCLPLYHVNSQAYSTMGTIAARATMVLAPRFSARRFWPEVTGHGVTMFNFIGAMLNILSQDERSPEEAANQVRLAYSGSVASLTPERRGQLEERFGLRLMTGFGMSETTFGFVEPYDEPPRAGSIGRPRQHPDPSVPRNEARVVADDGRDLATGETGELLLRNPVMMRGYHNDPERTREALRDGWLHTGDLVRFDEDGYFYFVDRKKDVIRTRGENVASLEVEQMLSAHPQVRQCAVIGVPSELGEEDILAFVVPIDDRLTAEALWKWGAERLAAFKVPRFIQFTDELPRTGTQKISKPELRERARTMTEDRHDRGERHL